MTVTSRRALHENSFYLLLASAACALAGIDNKRFNEAVAKKFYPCAPDAKTRGSARRFTENDIVALFIYAGLIEQKMHQRLAGQIACQVKSKIEEDTGAHEVKVPVYQETGNESVGPNYGSQNAEYSVYINHVFDVEGIREHIHSTASSQHAGDGV